MFTWKLFTSDDDVFNYIIVGSGISPGIRAEECPKKGNKNILLQVIENLKGNQILLEGGRIP